MREIKFRGRRVVKRRDLTGDVKVEEFFSVDKNGYSAIEEFTGCVDTHGEEIYEGDRVFYLPIKRKGTVVFERGAFGIRFDSSSCGFDHMWALNEMNTQQSLDIIKNEDADGER